MKSTPQGCGKEEGWGEEGGGEDGGGEEGGGEEKNARGKKSRWKSTHVRMTVIIMYTWCIHVSQHSHTDVPCKSTDTQMYHVSQQPHRCTM